MNVDYKSFVFPGGEVNVRVLSKPTESGPLKTLHRIRNSQDFFELAMLKDALLHNGVDEVDLILPYVPYQQQDRVCNQGEALSLKVFASLLNSLNFKSVTITDPHSDVTPALINNVRVKSQLDIVNDFIEFKSRVSWASLKHPHPLFVSPDAGANKKTAALAKFFNHKEFIRADKLRNLSTGEIVETIVYCDDLAGRDVIIADDICVGGGTFIALAKALHAKNCGKIILYITHGVFSNEPQILFQNGIDEIYTTNSFRNDLPLFKSYKFFVLDLEPIL